MSYNKQDFKANTVLHASQLNAMDEQINQTDGQMDNVSYQITALNEKINQTNLEKIDGAYVENGYLFLTSNGEIVVGNLGPFSGTGSGSGSENEARLTVKNVSGWLSKTVAESQECLVAIDWSSTEDGLATGNGIIKITNNGVTKATYDITQGSISVDLAKYLATGPNSVRITISDVYNNSRTINFSINVISISLTSTFDDSTVYNEDINFVCTPVGNINKILHFFIDGKEISTFETTSSNRQISFKIAKLQNGSHVLEVYFTSEIDGSIVKSNTLRYDLICSDATNESPIIASSAVSETAKQFETINIEYYIYNPKSLTSDVQLIVDDVVISTMVGVDRTKHIWSYRFDTDGQHILKIKTGSVEKIFAVTVSQSDIEVKAEENDLSLYLTAYGRSNNETTKNEWNYKEIKSIMKNFNYVSNGWVIDEDGNTVLRLTGEARVEIPVKPFKDDFRTTGKTIEVEFATRDVLDYDSIVISCFDDNTGIEYSAQMIKLASEQSSISIQYKENEHVRISFVVEKRNENRLIYVYINGIASGVIPYPESDDFSQPNAVNITIGSSKCTVDIYTIRIYENDLTRHQILNNFIADTHNLDLMLERYDRNNIFDEYGQIVISKLPKYLPYLVLTSEELPEYKGDKKVISGSYTNPQNPEKNFTFEDAEIDVQGTSSSGYTRKNYKIKFKGGFTIDGETVKKYQMTDDAIAVDTFVMKADVASSEGCNNVELVRLYNETCTYKTPPQKKDAMVRQGIDGFPIVIFWNNGTETTFLGKYNFNNDKGTKDVYGFKKGDESWEVLNNTSDRVLFRSDDFTTDDWLNDFEARYPDGNTDCTNLSAMVSWVKSTENDLEKFKTEFEDWFELKAMTYYYIFTETFLLVDSRAKNMFPSKIGGSNWLILPYDLDTAIGINNEGALAFSYNLEDIDQVDGADVFNGQNSILWKNFRLAFGDEIKSMYAKLRIDRTFSYDSVEKRFEDHQSKWSEAIFNEDAYFKYIQPLLESGSSAYLSMLQGSKAEQRKWWLYNRFRYLDSKYVAGDALSDIITLRGYAKGDITIKPYADIYATVKYGSYLVQQRATRGQTYTLACPLDNVNDTEIYVYSCSQILEIGDISPLKVGYADFSLATKLSALKIGDSSNSYSNTNLKELYLGNNVLLKTLDVRNCPNLTMAVDISKCTNVEEVYFDGTAISALALPNGGYLKTLHLPGTITNLTLRNQTALTEFVIPSYANVSTLWVENVSSELVNPIEVLEQIKDNSRVRVIGFSVDVDTPEELYTLYNKFDTFRGMDEYGNNTDTPQISGTVHVPYITSTQLSELSSRYPDISVTYDTITYIVEIYNGDVLLSSQYIVSGENASYTGTTPIKETDYVYNYTFSGWSRVKGSEVVDENAFNNITADTKIYAVYSKIAVFKVEFFNGTTLLDTQYIEEGHNVTYHGTTPSKPTDVYYAYTFSGWTTEEGGEIVEINALRNVTAARKIYAVYTKTDVLYTVRFVNGDTVLQAGTYKYGETPSYYGSEPVSTEGLPFIGWSPDIGPVTKDTTYTAKFLSTPTLKYSWQNCDAVKEKFGAITSLIFAPDSDPETYDTVSNVNDTNIPVLAYRVGTEIIITWDSAYADKISIWGSRTTHALANAFANIFNNSISILDVSNIDVSKLSQLNNAFYNCKATTITGLNTWDTSNVTNMSGMFNNSSATSLDLSNWNTGNVISTGYMFSGSSVVSLDLSNWNTSKVTDIGSMFSNSFTTYLDLSNWDTSKVTDMSGMFYNSKATTITGLDTWDTSKVTSMREMFYNSSVSSLDLSNWNTGKITSMSDMFDGSKVTTITGLDTWDTSNVTNMSSMFYNTSVTSLDLSNWNTGKVTNMIRMFYNSKATTITGLDTWDTSKVTNMSGMFNSSSVSSLDLSNWDTSKVTNMSTMFYNSFTTSLDLSNWNTSNVASMSSMFDGSKATTITGLNTWDTSNVTDMGYMFNASSVSSLDLSNWNTSKVTNMNYLFNASSASSLDVSNWDTSKITNMGYMFRNSKATTITGLDTWDTSNVTKMSDMFYASSVTSLDLSNWNTSKVTDIGYMFSNSKATTITGLDTWDTSNVTDMDYTFSRSAVTSLDLGNWNTSKVTNMNGMFYNNSEITSLIIPATNGNGLANTTERWYGKDSTVYSNLTGLTSCTITLAAA